MVKKMLPTVCARKELAKGLERTSKSSGFLRGRIIREQLEKVGDSGANQPFLRLAGTVNGSQDLSTLKGFFVAHH